VSPVSERSDEGSRSACYPGGVTSARGTWIALLASTTLGGCALGFSKSTTAPEDWNIYTVRIPDARAPSDVYAWFWSSARKRGCSMDRRPLPFRSGVGAFCWNYVIYFWATTEANVRIGCKKSVTESECYAHFLEIVQEDED